MKKMNKKGMELFNVLISGGIGLLVLSIVLIIIFASTSAIRDSGVVGTNTLGYNATIQVDTGVSIMPKFFSVIVIVLVGAGLIALVYAAFMRQQGGRV